MLTLVLGGTRSGKSARGEALAQATGLPVRYVATADPGDPSLRERIAAHQARRPHTWETVEASDLATAVSTGACVLVDGLGPWLAGHLERDSAMAGADAIIAAADQREVIVVAEEAGQGLLPLHALSRDWLDLLGDVVQRLSAAAARVELVVAGRPIALAASPAPPSSRVHGDALVGRGDADHAVNVLAGGPPDWLRASLAAALERVDAYPDEHDACRALARLHGREPEEIVPTNGAAQALWLLPTALRPVLAACVLPAFSEGEAALHAHGIPVARVLRRPQDDFALDPGAVPAAADLVVLGNPASPSGKLDPVAAIRTLRRAGRTIVVDEAFMDLVPGEPESLVREWLEDIVVIRSLTKAFAIPGLRAGYAVAAPALAERLRAARPPWSANALALAALTAVAQRPDALGLNAQRAQRERSDLEARLAGAGIRTWPAAANFVLVEAPGAAARLRAAGIAVRPASDFAGLTDDHVRITARSPEENARLVEVLTA